MKSYYNLLFTIIATLSLAFNANAQEKIPPYFNIGSSTSSMDETSNQVISTLEENGFKVIGKYNPEGNNDLMAIAYTRNDLQAITLKVEDRGILASILKIGLQKMENNIVVSMLNPTYLFYAYLREDTEEHISELNKITEDAKKAMAVFGGNFTGFGGEEKIKDLKDYHYMAFMPYFDDPVELHEFGTFNEGVETIRKNLQAKKGNTLKVYELILENEKIAIFGIGVLDKEDGEAKFLSIIGEENIAAMPYEIILTGNAATMLHGKFRFALHWPELSMGQFMKISSTPGDVEDFLKALTE